MDVNNGNKNHYFQADLSLYKIEATITTIK